MNRAAVSFHEAATFWVKLGFINFGGPSGQISLMHQELVERRRWISDAHFLHALNYCMLLPGPEAQQLAVYIGWLLHRIKGGLVAGLAFILPAFFLMWGLSWTFVAHGDVDAIAGIFSGLKAAVVGIVAAAVIRIGARALRSWLLVAIAAAAFFAIFVLHVPFPFIVLGAGAVGLVGGRLRPGLFELPQAEDEGEGTARDDRAAEPSSRPPLRRSFRVLGIGAAIWILPLAAVSLAPGIPEVIGDQALFFSQAAMVTFGGAYAVLAYINQAAVQHFGWLLPGQMVTGLGLAESTPGPLIMVTEFVGFVGAYQNAGGMDPLLAGTLGAVVATWATFAPCFLWIFLGAPYVERLRGNRALAATLSAITAAVVGVILNLALSFAILALFADVRTVELLGGPVRVPALASVDAVSAAIAVVAFVALWRFRTNIVWVIASSAAVGVLRTVVG